MKLKPKEGWADFSRSKELIDYAFSFSQKDGWHYVGPTVNTMVIEAPQSGSCIYLEISGESVVDFVVSQNRDAEIDFEQACADIISEFKLSETE